MKKILLYALFALIFYNSNSQNLVANPSFENHKDIICFNCHNKAQFEVLLPNWSCFQWLEPTVCDVNTNIYPVAYGICDFRKYKPKTGNTCIELSYLNRKHDHIGKAEREGYSTYLQAKLIKPLEKNKTYKLKLSAYIISKVSYPAPNYAKHIGFDLTKDEYRKKENESKANTVFSFTPFKLDTVINDKWYDYEWYIRPTTSLSYIQIGVFYNDDWLGNLDLYKHDGQYSIDDVEITEVMDTLPLSNKTVFDYPFTKLPSKKAITSPTEKKVEIDRNIYFTHDSKDIDKENQRLLDSLIQILKASNYTDVIDIIGHSDSTGRNDYNMNLSSQRANEVFNYFILRGTPQYCLNVESKGATEPISDNLTENGRRLNRRVQIKKSNYTINQQLYYTASQLAISNKVDSAYLLLTKWLANKDNEAQILFFDSDLENLKQSKYWVKIYESIKNRYATYKKYNYAFLLDSLYHADQLFRTLTHTFEFSKKYVPQNLDTLSVKETNILMEKMDKANLKTLIVLMKQRGWPKISDVGKTAASAAFYIIDHSDLVHMKEYLPVLEAYCKQEEADWEWYAMMYDRIQMYEEKPQRYGTQYTSDPKNPAHYFIYNLENKEKVDEYRRELGMPPIELWDFNMVFKKKNK